MKAKNYSAAQYVWGAKGAADYLGLSVGTFQKLARSYERTEQERELLKPRIVLGRTAYSKRNLDLFMSPALNAPGLPETAKN